MAAPFRLVQRANVLVFGVLVTILLTMGGLTWDRFNAAYSAREWTDRSYQVLRALKDLRIAIAETESNVRGYSLSGDEADLAGYRESLGQIAYLQSEIHQLVVDNREQSQRFDTLTPILQRRIDQLAAAVEQRRRGDTAGAVAALREPHARAALAQVQSASGTMLEEERRLLTARLDLGDQRNRWLGWMILAGTILSMIILMLAARMLNEAWARTSSVEAEQRDLAAQLRISLNSLSQGVGVFDADQTLLHWNHCFQHLLNLPKSTLRRGIRYAEIARQAEAEGSYHLESAEEVGYAVQIAAEPVVIERHRADGHVIELRRTGTPHGGFVLTVTDMTKRAEAESVLREAQKMQAIGQLTGGIAHDFNNLLQVILGNLEFAKSKVTGDERLTQRIERAIWAAQRGASLTAQLLAFARRQVFDPAPFDLGQSLTAFVPMLQRTLNTSKVDVRYQETQGLWPVMADAAQTESAILNLALNARDAMPGGGRLTIAVANTTVADKSVGTTSVGNESAGETGDADDQAGPTPGDYVTITVTDTGHGMTPEVLARVFEPFFTTKPEGKGTGLGLAMVFGFARQSNGHVAITSEPGRGTSVHLYLPRAHRAGQENTQDADGSVLPRGRAEILIVEDEPNVREVATVILRDLGYRIIEASDGDEGLNLFERHQSSIDLVLTDLILPGGLNGSELAQRIAAARPDLPVVLMTGSADEISESDAALPRMAKPFTRKDLAQIVSQILTQRPSHVAADQTKVINLSRR